MNTLTILAGVLLFFSTSLVGLWVKRRFIRKASFYESYYRYLQYARDKISYERMPIGEINTSYCKGKKDEFCDYLQGKTVALPLSEGEIDEVRRYLSAIGTSDADTELATLGGKCSEMKRFTEENCVKYRKDGTLYFKLAVLLGVVAFIIIV